MCNIFLPLEGIEQLVYTVTERSAVPIDLQRKMNTYLNTKLQKFTGNKEIVLLV